MNISADQITDRILIRECYGRYALAVASQDGPAWLDCWSADATWKTPSFEVSGHTRLEQMWDITWTTFTAVAAFNEVGEITVSGRSATARSVVFEVITLKSGALQRTAGLYTDRFVQEDGKWRFSRREYALISEEKSA